MQRSNPPSSREDSGTTSTSGRQSTEISPPAINLPKGGGAVRGIGEKFAANPVTGTGSMTVPIATSTGRSGFGPQLSLSYDSGAGNSPFGFGWSLSLPAITRKTDKGLPQYRDAEESDVFILSGAEDLVPVYRQDPDGSWVASRPGYRRDPDGFWVRDAEGGLVIHEDELDGYRVRRYRPRIEGLFARIERWINVEKPEDVHWRSLSQDNVLTLYGKDTNSRIYDPDDARRIFNWLVCETRDDKGNAVLYGYKPEDGVGVELTRAHERNRGEPDDLHRKTNRYLKRIYYGNRIPLLDNTGQRPRFLTDLPAAQLQNARWMFEVVFDYGEHDVQAPKPKDAGRWVYRQDPFSSYRAGFEVRTARLCRRVLMFHHFPEEAGVGEDCLVRSTDFTYSHEQEPDIVDKPVYTFLRAITQTGYRRQGSGYLNRSMPEIEFEYTQPIVQETVHDVDPTSLENLPVGLDGSAYQWTDLHGEGIPGILTEQVDAWFYKRNVSPISDQPVEFAPMERVATKPNLSSSGGLAQFMDLAGDGQPDLVVLDGPVPGLYEHDEGEGWQPFCPFISRLNREMRDPNLKLVDLDGDGHADVLISADGEFVWHASLGEEGFGSARRVDQALDEEKGPRLVFADGAQSIYLADLSGDGLTDLVRIRNGEVCYWPNLGYGRFGARVTMDHSPIFDRPEQFDQRRVRLADIDGTGTTDIIYLHRDAVRLYFNQSGNNWSAPRTMRVFPRVDDLVTITPLDLLGNGSACLVWSSPLPGDGRRQMRYVDLMGGQKPHLLIKTVNNLGAETRVEYASSTRFYLQDKRDGKPWITRLPFPVHVVESVDTFDAISGNHFVTRYRYHHGYFDGEEREFRGFGMVEQQDTEESAAPTDGTRPPATNRDPASHVPPVLTKTWFHTGLFVGRDHISDFFARLLDEYYREPGLNDDEARERLIADTILPPGLTAEEEREACRALKGAMLRQEVYAEDALPNSSESAIRRAQTPYVVTEQNFTVSVLQHRGANRHAIFFTHPREALTYRYERNSADPRISHTLTLKVDEYGNALRSVAVGYPRLDVPERQPEQNETHLTLTLNRYVNRADQLTWYRVGLPVETRTYEVVKPPIAAQRFTWEELRDLVTALVPQGQHEPPPANTIPYEQWDWRKQWNPQNEPGGLVDGVPKYTRLRLIEHGRTLYRRDDLTALLPLGDVETMALVGESYKLALTPGLLTQAFKRKRAGRSDEELLPTPGSVLEGKGDDQGGYVAMDGNWWIPTGRISYSNDPNHTAVQELAEARSHFFMPRRYRGPFGHDTVVTYDGPAAPNLPRYDLLITRTSDALGNLVTATNDYRVLQPQLVTDPNRNRTAVAFDALGMVVATAVMGKEGENLGDLLEGFDADPPLAGLQAFVADPRPQAASLLGKATTRIVHDLDRYRRTGQPPFAATLARETHYHDAGGPQTKIQVSVSYSDGFGREIQKKLQAEAGDAPQRQLPVPLPTGDIRPGDLVRDAHGMPVRASTPGRWVGSGRTVFNNKGKPVKQYEPFFSATDLYEPEPEMTDTGVSPVLFYDPVERIVATLHPNHTYEKVVFDAWQQTTYDVNDTVAAAGRETGDPRTDPDIAGYVSEYFKTQPVGWQTWHVQRIGSPAGDPERTAAEKSAAHANTPTAAHLDTLGRTYLTLADNGPDPAHPGQHLRFATRVELDIENNQRAVRDAKNCVVMRYDYDVLGNRIRQASMEAGERWTLNDVTGKPIRTWDSRGFLRRMTYDELRRPTGMYVNDNGLPRLAQRNVYGEGQGDSQNHRTRAHQVFDAAGIVTNVAYDFKGNLLESRRDLLPTYRQGVDWQTNPAANDGSFTSHTTFDALNRPLTVNSPDGSVYRPTFNEANLLETVDVNLRGAAAPRPFVINIDYNAKGQRELIEYGCGAGPHRQGVTTTYKYDEETFRLTRLRTTRPDGLNGPASQIVADPSVVQDLRYTYDPAGNITRIQDAALKTIFHDNAQVDPVCVYTYDALYRLIEARGREHIGQTAFDLTPTNGNRRDYPFAGLAAFNAHPNDVEKLRNYTEQYEYDAVGNFDIIRHIANGGSWTRRYDYEEESLLETGKQSNRLTRTRLGNGLNFTEAYTYTDSHHNDVHGCMTAINDMKLVWDFEDQLQQVDMGGGGTAYYLYDATGQRVRKVIESQAGVRRRERLYLGSFEVYREFNGNGATVTLERESLHVMDDEQRIALVETQTIENGNRVNAPTPLQRYQLGNHLGSATVELAEDGALISYEEYHPYGTTAFQAGRSAAEVSLKRYRYTGKERDEETGFSYHGARYYAPWLGRWSSCDRLRSISRKAEDPEEMARAQEGDEQSKGRTGIANSDEQVNLYRFSKDNPVVFVDIDGNDPASKVAQAAGRSLVRRFFNELGEKGARLLAGRVSRAALKELAEGLAPKVEKHILEHAEEVTEKAVHSIFKSGTGKQEVLALIKETVKTGGKGVLSQTENSSFAWVFEKEFRGEIGSKGQKILRVVVDREGKVITAFPVDSLIKRMSIRGLQVSAQLAAVAFVAGIYEEEARAADADTVARYKARDEDKSWLETGLEWIVPFGLAESSPIALEPNFRKIGERTKQAISNAEKEFGRKLTSEEADTIGREIYNIWADTSAVHSD